VLKRTQSFFQDLQLAARTLQYSTQIQENFTSKPSNDLLFSFFVISIEPVTCCVCISSLFYLYKVLLLGYQLLPHPPRATCKITGACAAPAPQHSLLARKVAFKNKSTTKAMLEVTSHEH